MTTMLIHTHCDNCTTLTKCARVMVDNRPKWYCKPCYAIYILSKIFKWSE